MKLVVKDSKVNMKAIRKLEALGFVVTVLISSVAGAQDLQRGDLNAAVKASEAELRAIAERDPDAFDMENFEEQGALKYMCDPANGSYSAELDKACAEVTVAQRK